MDSTGNMDYRLDIRKFPELKLDDPKFFIELVTFEELQMTPSLQNTVPYAALSKAGHNPLI